MKIFKKYALIFIFCIISSNAFCFSSIIKNFRGQPTSNLIVEIDERVNGFVYSASGHIDYKERFIYLEVESNQKIKINPRWSYQIKFHSDRLRVSPSFFSEKIKDIQKISVTKEGSHISAFRIPLTKLNVRSLRKLGPKRIAKITIIIGNSKSRFKVKKKR